MLTAATGGTQLHFRKQSQLEDGIAAIGIELRSAYLLSYYPNSPGSWLSHPEDRGRCSRSQSICPPRLLARQELNATDGFGVAATAFQAAFFGTVLDHVKHHLEAIVHVQLLVTMKQHEPLHLGDHVYLHLLMPLHHHHIFHQPGSPLSIDAGYLEAASM